MKSIVCFGRQASEDYIFQSNFAGLLSITEDIHHWPPEQQAKAKRHIEVYKSIRHLLNKDFYPLFPQPLALEDWDGWEFHDPAKNEGFLLAFRSRAPEQTAPIHARGAKAGRKYRLVDPYSREEQTIEGERLNGEGLSLTLPLNGTKLWTYRPA